MTPMEKIMAAPPKVRDFALELLAEASDTRTKAWPISLKHRPVTAIGARKA
jgi:hypothetical protein